MAIGEKPKTEGEKTKEEERKALLAEAIEALTASKKQRESVNRSAKRRRQWDLGPNQGLAFTDELSWTKTSYSFRVSRKDSTENLAAHSEVSGKANLRPDKHHKKD
jgi:hypothetical protein